MRSYLYLPAQLLMIPLAFLPRGVACAVLDKLMDVTCGPKGKPYVSRTSKR